MNSKQREELQRISAAITTEPLPNGLLTFTCKMPIREVKRIVDTVLAEPLRNCEVGTVEEQAQRFNDYCHKQGNSCCVGRSKGACPMFRGYKVDCGIVWSQTPYEESEAKKCN